MSGSKAGESRRQGGYFYVSASVDMEKEDFKKLLQLPEGRRMFRRILSLTRMAEALPFGCVEPLEFYEGMRRIGIRLADSIESAKKGGVAELMAESANDKANRL